MCAPWRWGRCTLAATAGRAVDAAGADHLVEVQVGAVRGAAVVSRELHGSLREECERTITVSSQRPIPD